MEVSSISGASVQLASASLVQEAGMAMLGNALSQMNQNGEQLVAMMQAVDMQPVRIDGPGTQVDIWA